MPVPKSQFAMGWGKRIKVARQKAKLTQVQLGQIVGVGQNTISLWEKQKNEPKLEDFRKIAHATGEDPAWLAFGPEYLSQPVRTFAELSDRVPEDYLDWLLEGMAQRAKGSAA